MRARPSFLMAVTILAVTAGCGERSPQGPTRISMIGEPRHITQPLTHAATQAGQMMLQTTARGLVTWDGAGDIISGLAQRWIVLDDGHTYIFRLRRARWADGERVDARDVARLLTGRLAATRSDDPYGPLTAITGIQAMTTDVIEVRLSSPQPHLLLALAHPHLAIARRAGGTGPYSKQAVDGAVHLFPAQIDMTTAPEAPAHIVRAESAAFAVARFRENKADLVLGGTYADLPMTGTPGIDRRALRIDSARGLFGLALTGRSPFLADAQVRAAISMGLDRGELSRLFIAPGWTMSETILPGSTTARPSWANMPMAERRTQAAAIIAQWKAAHPGAQAQITVNLDTRAGSHLLFMALARDFGALGIATRRSATRPDMVLVDALAPYDDPIWYLGQLSCARMRDCAPAGDDLLDFAQRAKDPAERARLIGEAEAAITGHGAYIPLASPLRWSLVRGGLTGVRANPRAHHPLTHLMQDKR